MVKVEEVGLDDFVEVNVTVVTVDDFCLWLYGSDNLADASEFIGFHLAGFVEKDDVAELNLLYDEVFNIVFFDILSGKLESSFEFVFHAEGIDDGDDAVEAGYADVGHLGCHRGYGADGLCDRCRFTDAAGFNDDVVEAVHGDDVSQLFDKVHLQCAADAAVLKGNEAFVLLSDDASLLDEVGINIHFADVVDDDGKLNALFVGENSI